MSQESLKKILNSGRKIRILVAAGGSGGHIFPALQVMQAISDKIGIPAGRLKIEFICSNKVIDAQIYQRSGYLFHPFAFKGVKGKGIRGAYSFLADLPNLLYQMSCIINSFKPDVVVGFGGFPSVLPLIEACLKGIPTWVHESDQKAGLANKFLSLFVKGLSSSFDNVSFPTGRQSIYTGHPIRSDLLTFTMEDLNFSPQSILILGGSQASRALDLSVPKAIAALRNSINLKVLHQARAENLALVQDLYATSGVSAEVASFFDDMPSVYNQADIIISRAGSGAIAELSILNKPVIFVPIPNVSGHQLQNAKWLEKTGKALIVEEGENFELRLEDALSRLLQPVFYRQMVAEKFEQRRTKSAELIARQICNLID